MKKTVVVGLSGGVDSAVSALLLKKQGYNVIGIFMKNWEDDGICSSSSDYLDVIETCKILDIPYYSINFVEEYREKVFSHFLEEYKKGLTPNPDILCNREIKFNLFFKKATKEIKADFLATGHYCQNISINGKNRLVKGKDQNKDQSYFIYTIKAETLKKVLFPIGNLTKKEVREIAKKNNLPIHDKKDSTGICFIGKRTFAPFLEKFLGYKEGPIKTLDGEILGKHIGCPYYTLGQRKGLCIGGKGDAWFVVDKDIKTNTIIVAQGKDHPALFCDSLVATDLSWVNDMPTSFPFSCFSKIRYRQQDQQCTITKIENNKAYVQFTSPQRAATPRQSIVFYKDDICLGGGMIESTGPSFFTQKKNL